MDSSSYRNILFKYLTILSTIYIADSCSPLFGESLDVKSGNSLQRALGGNVVLEGPLSSDDRGSVKKPDDLLCTDFNNCLWHNDRGANLKWYRATGTLDVFRLQAITGTNMPPRSPFIVVATSEAKAPSESAMLTTSTIPCQKGDGEMRFKYWISPSVQISVCVRLTGKQKFEYCSLPVYSGSPGPAFVTLRGPILQPFEIVIVANHFTYNDGLYAGGLAIIDDLDYNGEICKSEKEKSEVSSKELLAVQKPDEKEKKTNKLQTDEKTCMLLKCDFADGYCPHYKQTPIWQNAKGPVGNPVTGIRGDASTLPFNVSGRYLYVEGPQSKAPLETMAFSLNDPVLLKFAYYQAAVESNFRVFVKRLDEDVEKLFQSPKATIDSRKWVMEKKLLNAGKYEKIIFEATNVKPHAFLGLDEITLLTQDGQPLC